MNSQSRTTRIEHDPMFNLERELKIRGFSHKTIKSYLYYNKKFLNYVRKSPKEITNEDIKRYLEYLANKRVSNATLNLAINALKFYYTQILKRKFFFDIKHPKKEKRLPVVLTKDEIRSKYSVNPVSFLQSLSGNPDSCLKHARMAKREERCSLSIYN